MKPAKPAPETETALVAHLQKLIGEHLPGLLLESEAMSAHLLEMGEVRRDFSLKVRLGTKPGEPIARANIALAAHTVGTLGEEKARTSCEHSIRPTTPATPRAEDPGQARLL